MQKLFRSGQLAALSCVILATSVFAADAPEVKIPVTQAQQENATVKEDDSTPAPKVLFKPGQTLETTTDTQDIVATWDIELAKKQVSAFPDSPEASFILAVALTRTSRVEEALQEVQRARRLAGGKGGPAYFDKMIEQYEKMLTAYPDDNQVRYGLAWAYYMKAYLLGQHSRRVAKWKAVNMPQAAAANGTPTTPAPATTSGGDAKDLAKALQSGNIAALAGAAAQVASGKGELPKIPTALQGVEPADVPAIKGLYQNALGCIDEFLKRDPKDVWARSYGAHLRAEYTGDVNAAIATWQAIAKEFPNNPAPYFFLGEGYLKQGNLRESLNNVGKAISLRALGN